MVSSWPFSLSASEMAENSVKSEEGGWCWLAEVKVAEVKILYKTVFSNFNN